MLLSVLFIAVVLVAYTNGANANFKGVASLYGSGTTRLLTAAWWGTGTTFLGSLTAYFLADGLRLAFSGRGLVPDALARTPDFLCAVALGAAGTSFLATRMGFPVSTTHALVGALIGTGLVGGGEMNGNALGAVLLLPLLVSPIIAAIFGAGLCAFLWFIKANLEQRRPWLDAVHFASAGGASFARGLNDTPKIVAPMLVIPGLELHWAFLVVALAIATGGLLDIRNVAETLGKKLTGMNPGQGLVACVVTAGLVTTASLHSLPVSTTHVSVGSLLGMGAVARQARWKKAGEVILAWLCTVPCGAVLAAIVYVIIVRC